MQKIKKYLDGLKKKFFSLPTEFRMILAGLLSFIVVFGSYYTYNQVNNIFFKKEDKHQKISLTDDEIIKQKIDEIRNLTVKFDPIKNTYDVYRIEDLEIYPEGWIKRNFSESEIRNTLISGPAGDYDKDGLINKIEFIYGSDPKNMYTLCGTNEGEEKCKLTDKENIDKGINPLTGINIDNNQTIKLSKDNKNLLDSIKNTYNTSSSEGVDFPVLYQLSKTIDLNSEYEQKKPSTIPFDRKSAINYLELRLKIINTLVGENKNTNPELGSLYQIYSVSSLDKIEIMKNTYNDLLNQVNNTLIPENYKNSHAVLMLLVEKIVALIDHRIENIKNNTIFSLESQEKSKKLAVEIVWCYRKLIEIKE